MIRLSVALAEAEAEALEGWLYERPELPWMVACEMPAGRWRLEGFFAGEEEAKAHYGEIAGEHPFLPREPRVEALEDRDWKEAYKLHLRPWSCGPLHWVPEWERGSAPAPAGGAVVYLDSGMAFGTGSHETTRLCAREIVRFQGRRDLAGCRVLDAGCGSGILGLSAAALGCREVTGFDVDADAVRISRENAAVNGLEHRAQFAVAGVEEGCRGVQADLVLANIETPVLREFAPDLLAATAPGGWLVLSGILRPQAEGLAEVYRRGVAHFWPEGGAVEETAEGEWSCFQWMRGRD